MNSYFYLFEYPQDVIPEFILDKKKYTPTSKESQVYSTFNNLQQLKKKLRSKNKKISNLLLQFDQAQRFFYQPFTSRLYFHFKDAGAFLIASNKESNSYHQSFNVQNVSYFFQKEKENEKVKDISQIKKYKDIYFTMFVPTLYEKYKNTINSIKTKKTFKNNLKTLYQLYDYLEIGGVLFYSNPNIILDDHLSINTIYLLSLLFERIIITHHYQRPHFMCLGFQGEKRLSKKRFEWIIDHYKQYKITPEPNRNEILSTLSFITSNQNKITNYLVKDDISKWTKANFLFDLLTIYQFNHTSQFIKNIQQNYLEYFHFQLSDSQLIQSFISFDKKDIKWIYKKINNKLHKKKEILQLGLSYGSFTDVFHQQFKNSHFTILDPLQESQWDNMGLLHLDQKNIPYQFLESDYIYSFNQLVDKKKSYDIIILIVDETYENLASYFLFLNTLLKKNGILILNSLSTPYLHLQDYIQKSLVFYHPIALQNNISIYQKTL
jgi:hypothetical protein